jgi:hypothetical protein
MCSYGDRMRTVRLYLKLGKREQWWPLMMLTTSIANPSIASAMHMADTSCDYPQCPSTRLGEPSDQVGEGIIKVVIGSGESWCT